MIDARGESVTQEAPPARKRSLAKRCGSVFFVQVQKGRWNRFPPLRGKMQGSLMKQRRAGTAPRRRPTGAGELFPGGVRLFPWRAVQGRPLRWYKRADGIFVTS